MFLISMRGMSSSDLLMIKREVKKEFSTLGVGVNLLGECIANVLNKLDFGVSGLWADKARINE